MHSSGKEASPKSVSSDNEEDPENILSGDEELPSSTREQPPEYNFSDVDPDPDSPKKITARNKRKEEQIKKILVILTSVELVKK